jgi:2-polyprenyl-6-methoxyphenol hydroxylase-like FAD-dependent oxidoreductase
MKIAVLGGGTAGFVAAAHLTRHLPAAELFHVFDSRIPTIGIGEGTTPRFSQWFEEVTGLGFDVLAARCRATLKKGLRFEGWGVEGAPFVNRFQPTRLIAYHFDAGDLITVLREHVRAQHIDARVEQTETLVDGVRVRLENGTTHICDYVFDARGFPRNTGDGVNTGDVIQLTWIPTGRAMLRRLQPLRLSGVSRTVARPHGWIFQVPLQGSTSCGYVFNPRINSDAEVADDFTEFLRDEGIVSWVDRGALAFPNFVRRDACDGRLFWLGNSAAFVEPLEATAICTAILEMRAATRRISDHGSSFAADRDDVEAFNRSIRSFNIRNSLFIGWHYACGSRWDSPFWRYARQGLENARDCEWARPHLADMEAFQEAGRHLPGRALAEYEDQDQWDREVYPLLRLYRPFGNFSELNFAQVGHGIGYYMHCDKPTPSVTTGK